MPNCAYCNRAMRSGDLWGFCGRANCRKLSRQVSFWMQERAYGYGLQGDSDA